MHFFSRSCCVSELAKKLWADLVVIAVCRPVRVAPLGTGLAVAEQLRAALPAPLAEAA